MRKFLITLLFLFGVSASVFAQSPQITTQMTTTTTATGTGIAVPTTGYHMITWTLTGPAPTACTVAVDSSPDNSSWTAGGAIPGQTCTSGGQSAVVNLSTGYIRINVTAFTGTGTLKVFYLGTSGISGSSTTSTVSIGAPVGTCAQGALDTDKNTGNVYGCNNGTWVLSSGSGTFGPNYSVGGGTAQAQTVAPTTAVTNATLVNGFELCWLPSASNTGAAPTLAGSGTSTFSAKPITKYPGTSALVLGDISSTNGSIACARYDSTEFQLLNPQTGWSTGILPRSQTTTSDTIAGTDRGNGIIENNGGAIAVTTASTLGVAPLDNNFFFFIKDIGAGTATITPTGGAQIAGNNGTLGATLAVTTGQTAYCYSDNTNFQCTVAGGASASAFPLTVSGATSGGIPYFSSNTQESSSALLQAHSVIFAQGAGNAPLTTDSFGSNILTSAAGVFSFGNNGNGDNTYISNAGQNPFLGTGDIYIQFNPVNVAAWSGMVDAGSIGLGLGTSGARPVAIAPNKTITARFQSGGGLVSLESAAPTNIASSTAVYEDSTQHEEFAATAGSSTFGMKVRVQPGIIHQTAKTAAITTATLCAASAGACNIAGNYTIEWAFTQVGTACGTPGAGGVTFLLTWTDQNGVTHSAIQMPMDDAASLVATTGTFHFTTSNATAWGSGNMNISSNGAILQYATGYTACGVGTGSYQLDAWVTRKE